MNPPPTPPVVGIDRRMAGGVEMFARCWWAPGGAAERPPIVLVHGLALSGRYLVPTASRLAAALVGDVYAPDLPGFGHSGRPRTPLDVPGLAAALGAWLDALALPGAVLVGHSLGAEIVAELARWAPSHAAALVLAAPTVDPVHRHATAEIARLLWDAPRERPGLIALAAAAYVRVGPRRALAALRAAIAYRIEDTLPTLTVPAQVVWGTRDPLVSAAWAAQLGALTCRPPVALAGAPHGLPFSAAARFAAVVVASARALGWLAAGRGVGSG